MAYDLTAPSSLRNVEAVWLQEVKKYASPESSLMMVGNKLDLASAYSLNVESTREMAENFTRYCAPGKIVANVETSAKTGEGVEDAFLCLVRDMMKKVEAKVSGMQRESKQSQLSCCHQVGHTTDW